MSQLQSLAVVLIRLWAAVTFTSIVMFSLPSLVGDLVQIFSPQPPPAIYGSLPTIVMIIGPLLVSGLAYAKSHSLASFMCRGVSQEAFFEGISARAIATIGTGLLGLYLITTGIPGAVQAFLFASQRQADGMDGVVITNAAFWEQTLPVIVGVLILASSVSIGRLLSDYRKLGLEDSSPTRPSQNTKQS